MINQIKKKQSLLPKLNRILLDKPGTFRSLSKKSKQLLIEGESRLTFQLKELRSPKKENLNFQEYRLNENCQKYLIMSIKRAQHSERYPLKTNRDDPTFQKENHQNIFVSRQKFSAAKKNIHRRIGCERVVLSSLKTVKRLRLEDMREIREEPREELTGWSSEEDGKVPDFCSEL